MSDINSSRDHQTEQKTKFVPSDPDASYLSTNKADLKKLAKSINSSYAAGTGFAKKATESMMECGRFLLKARELFKGDNEFGKWRKANVDFSASYCSRIMAVTREFGDNKKAMLLPMGTLAELIPASDSLKDEVLDKAEKGEKVLKKDVKAAKIAEKGEEEPTPSTPAAPEGASTDVVLKTEPREKIKVNRNDPVGDAQAILDLDFLDRIAKVDITKSSNKQVDAFMIFGLSPFHDGAMSLDVIHALWHSFGPLLGTDLVLMARFQQAYDTLLKMYK